MSDTARTTRRRLSRSRLAPVGGRGLVGAAAWAAGAALVVGAGWLGWSALRPLETGASAAAEVASAPLPPGPPDRTLDARQRELDALAGAANLFAPSRAAWPAIAEQTTDQPEQNDEVELAGAEVGGDPDDQARPGGPASPGDPIASIPVETTPPPAVAQRLKALSLLGIYGVDDDLTAVIRDSTFSKDEGQTRHHRPGDIVGKEEWELLAVDAERDRVILRRANVNVELRMYPETVVAAAADASEPPVSAKPTPDDVRRDLEAAGVSADDIEEFLRLAQSDESLDGDPPAQADASTPGESPSNAGSPAMPTELSALLREMARETTPQGERGIDRFRRDREKTEERESEGEGG